MRIKNGGASWIGLVILLTLLGGPAVGKAQSIALGEPGDWADRLISIIGEHSDNLVVAYSLDGGAAWYRATVYPGTTIDQWRTTGDSTWTAGTIYGWIPTGQQQSVWNYFYDIPMPMDSALLRIKREGDGQILLEQEMDLRGASDVFVADHRNFTQLAGGSLPSPWTMVPGTEKSPAVDSVFCSVADPYAPPLVLAPELTGWHHIFVGMETNPTVRVSLSQEGTQYPVPEYLATPTGRPMQEVYIKSADMTGQDVNLALGGARHWRDASVRHVRFVPMTEQEVTHFHNVRDLAETQGRPFAGYVEQCTPAYYEPDSLTLLDHTRNEMQLNKARGSTDVYVHAIRAGSKAWYHSDVVDRFTGWGNWGNWMAQGDPMAVAVTEGHAAGLKVFADMGMNVSYTTDGLRESTITEHPEYLYGGSGIFLDYNVLEVRDYVVSIATELMTKYDVDGINLDFARFAPNYIFTEASLVNVVQRIDAARQAAEVQWGHEITVATRIPSYLYDFGIYSGDFPEFVAALETWAANGWIDRVMACHYGTVEYANQLELDRYAEAIEGTDVELWGDLYGIFGGTAQSDWLAAAREWVTQGLDGGFFFYTTDRPTEFEQINWQLRLVDFPGLHVFDYLLPGDLNGDGFVGSDDLDIVRGFWGQTVTPSDLLHGDPSGDGFVGGEDLDFVRANWGQGIPPVPGAQANVPEPGILTCVMAGALGLIVLGRRHKVK